MAYCSNCGNQLAEGAKFCSNCGTAVDSENNNQRKTSYDGVIHKCPNCGEVMPSFSASCPTCGYELRGAKGNNSVQELVLKLLQIENEEPEKNKSWFGRKSKQSDDEKDEKQERKINLIKNYPIPNTKEDILEYAVLAASNVKPDADAEEQELSDAWLTKLEQAYRKAKIILADDSRLIEIQKLYDDIHASVKEKKAADRKSTIFYIIAFFGFLILWMLLMKFMVVLFK